MTHTINGMPLGMAAGEWVPVTEFDGDLGYTDLLRKGIENQYSLLSLVRKKDNLIDRFVKDDAPLQSSTTGAWNTIYGRDVYVWTNMQHPFLLALGKQPWVRSGRRIKTANSTTLTTGMGETDALPPSLLPTYGLMKFGLKQIVTRLDYTAKMKRLAASGDDSIPTPEQLRADKTEEHVLGLGTEGLLLNAETVAGAAAANNAGVTVFEALDRVIACDDEEDDLGGTHDGYYDPWADQMTADRDTGTDFDAVVVHGDGSCSYKGGTGTFTSDVTLSLDAKDVLLLNCLKNGLKKENAFWMTGWDTYFRLKQLFEVKERIMNPVKVTFGVNGVSTPSGTEVGMAIASMDDIPIIVDPNCPKDTISKLFLIDRSNVFMQMATPTVSIDLGFPAFSTISATLAQRLGYGEILLTEGELCATRLNTSGKLCALK